VQRGGKLARQICGEWLALDLRSDCDGAITQHVGVKAARDVALEPSNRGG
jgi:hypothetical protein